MRRVSRVSFAALAAALLAGVTCSFPTDQSDQVFVTVTLTAPLVVQGASITAHGHAFRKTGSGNVPVNDVDFVWTVSDSTVARIVNDGRGTATITGVNAGLVHVVARAAVYEKSADLDSVIRVSRALEIDSIKPKNVLYGGRITVYGVGINSIFLATLGAGTLIPDTFSFVGNRNGLGHMQFWVPAPSGTGRMLAFGPGVFGSSPETTFVGDHDIYDPDDTIPTTIDLDSAGPIPQLAALRFFNPALFFKTLDRTSSFAIRWFNFEQADTTQPETFVFTTIGQGRDTSIFNILTDSIYYTGGGGYAVGDSAWIIAPTQEVIGCKGINNTYFVPFAQGDSAVVELGNQTGHTFAAFVEYVAPGPFGLKMVRGQVRFDPNVAPDRFSPNEICNQADANFTDPNKKISVHLGSLPFVDTTLTIDFPHATDWYRFRMDTVNAADLQDTVSIMTVSRTSGAKDTSDIDVTVIGADNLIYYGQAIDSGSTEHLKVFLPTNQDYYVVVSDFAGAPVRYGLCITVATTCAALPPPIPAPPGMASRVPLRALRARSAIARVGVPAASQSALDRLRRHLSRLR